MNCSGFDVVMMKCGARLLHVISVLMLWVEVKSAQVLIETVAVSEFEPTLGEGY